LLLSDIRLSRPFGDWSTYARAQSWQALQDSDSQFTNPYQRLPQVGARTQHQLPYGMQMGFELEFNHFVNPEDTTPYDRVEGSRLHSLMSFSRPWISPGWTITPKVSMNAATYSLNQEMADGRKEATRVIPTLSVDSAWTLERDTALFGKEITQTLEPRIFYVYTPYRDQNDLPNFDAAGKTITPYSLFSENAFSGVDRVSDANQVTTGLTTRLLDSVTSGELVRLGILQSFLFSEQKVTPNGQPQDRGFSDILLFASTNVIPHWALNGETQYNPALGKFETSTAGAAYSPGAFRTVALNYRYTRDQSEQIEMGWQWPLFGRTPDQMSAMGSPRDCSGALYSVGRGNYSIRDKRLIDSLLGFEYDAGCWIARVVMNRQSTGQAQATTQVMFQLELVGLSRIGANPLAVLKQNIPGYRLLRDGPPVPQISSTYD
jgi:LPS-assembly protein